MTFRSKVLARKSQCFEKSLFLAIFATGSAPNLVKMPEGKSTPHRLLSFEPEIRSMILSDDAVDEQTIGLGLFSNKTSLVFVYLDIRPLADVPSVFVFYRKSAK